MIEFHKHDCPKDTFKAFNYIIIKSGKIAYAKVGVYEVMLPYCPNCGIKLMDVK